MNTLKHSSVMQVLNTAIRLSDDNMVSDAQLKVMSSRRANVCAHPLSDVGVCVCVSR